ncbi:MAG: glycoside hydrolase family 3 C-terminal domain-containing protein [Spirochaetales bacterium]|nr:glycoside hydrolase family 3 C-terminal domain-containing protein [Spirochaetales bacterium]
MKKNIISILYLLFSVTFLFSQVYKDPNASIEERVNDLLSRMTLRQKIGQMTQAEKNALDPGDVGNNCIGSILSGADSEAEPNNIASDWADMYDEFQREAMNASLGIPVIYGVDAIHGFGNVNGATVFPHNIGLGAARDPDLLEEIGRIVAREVAATGVDMTFGPCLTVPRNERWGRTYEGFGEDPEIHRLLGGRYVTGFQGQDLSGGERICATAKHWVGDGGTTNGKDRGDTQATEQELRDIHMAAYESAFSAGVGSVMISYSSWNSQKCHGSGRLITDILKNEKGFDGFVISDYNGIMELSGSYSDQVRAAVNAGIDLFMEPFNWQSFMSTLESLVANGQVSESRIDDAVRRILRIKFRMGLFEHPYADRSLLASVGSTSHRAVAREAVRKSLVLLKNDGVLPLSKSGSVFVAGKNADDIGNQCGGWTISWQGSSGNITEGTTILQGIRNTIGSSGKVTFSRNGSGAQGHDVAVVVIGETPYAESRGDSNDLSLASEDISVLNTVSNAGIPMVVVLVSGRPMLVTGQIGNWNAFVAAWLPGSEGMGVADVLFGDYDFSGRLAFTWPRDMGQIPVNVGDAVYDPLFAYGEGLSYGGTTPGPTSAPSGQPGDVNENGTIDIVDALLVAQYYVGLFPAAYTAPESIGDVNGNGNVDIVDALLIAQFYVGIITGFP